MLKALFLLAVLGAATAYPNPEQEHNVVKRQTVGRVSYNLKQIKNSLDFLYIKVGIIRHGPKLNCFLFIGFPSFQDIWMQVLSQTGLNL